MGETVLVVYRKFSDAQPYARAIENASAQPVLQEVRAGLKIEQCSGLLLTGGTDVAPALYGETAAPETEQPDEERDAVEVAPLHVIDADDDLATLRDPPDEVAQRGERAASDLDPDAIS